MPLGDLFDFEPQASTPDYAPAPVDNSLSYMNEPGPAPLPPSDTAQPGAQPGYSPPNPVLNGLAQAILGGFALGGHGPSFNVLGMMQRQQLVQQQMAQQKAYQDKHQAIETANTLGKIFEIAPGYREPMIKAWARNAGLNPDDPDIKDFAALAKKVDEEDSAGVSEALKSIGVDAGNTGEVLARIKDPKMRLEMGIKLAQNKKKMSVQELIDQYQPTPPPGSNAPASEPQEVTPAVQLRTLGQERAKLAQLRTNIMRIDPHSEAMPTINAQIDDIDKRLSFIRGDINRVEDKTESARRYEEGRQDRAIIHADLEGQRSITNQLLAQRERDRREDQNSKPMPGVFADKTTGEIRTITQAEFKANPSNFKSSNRQDQSTVDLLTNTGPIIDQLEATTQKVLAKYKGQHLAKVMQNYTKGKLGNDPDVAELQQLGNMLSVELTRALAGTSRPALGLFHAIQGTETPGLTVTADVAQRQLSNARAAIKNRISSLTGRPLEPIRPQGTGAKTAEELLQKYGVPVR